MFGVERLVTTIASANDKTARGIFNHITIELSRFMGYQHRQFDDITLITVQFRENDDLSKAHKEIPSEMITEWNWS
ncbi:MAG: PPM-type phosphatase protein [Patescibacteria group bacterium]|nr:PPM-type phosphatase protein [Patescibacteria group bacterium]